MTEQITPNHINAIISIYNSTGTLKPVDVGVLTSWLASQETSQQATLPDTDDPEYLSALVTAVETKLEKQSPAQPEYTATDESLQTAADILTKYKELQQLTSFDITEGVDVWEILDLDEDAEYINFMQAVIAFMHNHTTNVLPHLTKFTSENLPASYDSLEEVYQTAEQVSELLDFLLVELNGEKWVLKYKSRKQMQVSPETVTALEDDKISSLRFADRDDYLVIYDLLKDANNQDIVYITKRIEAIADEDSKSHFLEVCHNSLSNRIIKGSSRTADKATFKARASYLVERNILSQDHCNYIFDELQSNFSEKINYFFDRDRSDRIGVLLNVAHAFQLKDFPTSEDAQLISNPSALVEHRILKPEDQASYQEKLQTALPEFAVHTLMHRINQKQEVARPTELWKIISNVFQNDKLFLLTDHKSKVLTAFLEKVRSWHFTSHYESDDNNNTAELNELAIQSILTPLRQEFKMGNQDASIISMVETELDSFIQNWCQRKLALAKNKNTYRRTQIIEERTKLRYSSLPPDVQNKMRAGYTAAIETCINTIGQNDELTDGNELTVDDELTYKDIIHIAELIERFQKLTSSSENFIHLVEPLIHRVFSQHIGLFNGVRTLTGRHDKEAHQNLYRMMKVVKKVGLIDASEANKMIAKLKPRYK